MTRTSTPILIVVAVVQSLSLGCASTSNVVTERPGATVIRESDGEELGQTPYAYETKGFLWESEKLKVVQGSKTAVVEMKRSEIDMLPMVGGACLTLTGIGACAGIPIILAGGMKLPAETPVDFDKKRSSAEKEASSSSSSSSSSQEQTLSTKTKAKKKKPAARS